MTEFEPGQRVIGVVSRRIMHVLSISPGRGGAPDSVLCEIPAIGRGKAVTASFTRDQLKPYRGGSLRLR